jgi:hypothetical protein
MGGGGATSADILKKAFAAAMDADDRGID